MATEAREQDTRRKEVVVGSVNTDERALIEQARVRGAFPNMSVFVRETMLRRAAEIMAPKRRGEQAA